MRTPRTRSVACSLAAIMLWSPMVSADSEWDPATASVPIAALAVLHPTDERPVVGEIHFRSAGDSLVIQLELGGLEPNRRYRLQIHEYGDCSANRAENAGAPFGDPAELIEFSADEEGWAEISFSHRGHTLSAGPDSLMGHSVVVHGVGEMVGCGTIGFAMRREAPSHSPEDPG